jgi:gamma-glutamyl-gamma-aminobutyrate hydrolase PuuD
VGALEEVREGRFAVGLRWHPEMLMHEHAGPRRLFEDFIEAATQYHDANALTYA